MSAGSHRFTTTYDVFRKHGVDRRTFLKFFDKLPELVRMGRGRDPRTIWALAERICGVCTTVHALASVPSVENALGITVPKNADIIRNIMFLTQYVQDHVVHFYHLHALDGVDVVSAPKADPAATAAPAQKVSPSRPTSTPAYYKDTQATIKKFVDSGQLGIFQNAYWCHPAYKLPPEGNLMAVAHYLEALQWQKEIVKIHTIFGGKNPHPNYLVGGVAYAINMEGDSAINMERLNQVRALIQQAIGVVENLYLPDLLAVASFYPEWTKIGGGLGSYIVYGDLPQNGNNDPSKFRIPRGVVLNKNLNEVLSLDLADANQVIEEISHSWHRCPNGKTALRPWDGVTEANYTGPKPPHKNLDETAPTCSRPHYFQRLGHWIHIREGKSANTRWLCPPPGTPLHGTQRVSLALMGRRSLAPRWRTRSVPWRSAGRFIRLIRVWPALRGDRIGRPHFGRDEFRLNFTRRATSTNDE